MTRETFMKHIKEKFGADHRVYIQAKKYCRLSESMQKVLDNFESEQTQMTIPGTGNGNRKVSFEKSLFNNYENTRNELLKSTDFVERYRGVDLKYYINRVLKWSYTSGYLKSDKQWFGYILKFMDSDIEKRSLVLRESNDAIDNTTFLNR